MITIEIPHTVLELHRFCAAGDGWENLTRIRVGPDVQVATNGHVLATSNCDLAKGLPAAGDVVYIPATVAKAALVGFKRGSPYTYQVECDENGDLTLVTRRGGEEGPVIATHVIADDTQSGNYPDYKTVFPEKKAIVPISEIGLDLKLLGLFHAFLKRLGETGGTLFKFSNPLGPAIASRTLSDGTEVTFIIMPIRV